MWFSQTESISETGTTTTSLHGLWNFLELLLHQVVLGPNYDPRVTGEPENGLPVKFSFCGHNEEERISFFGGIFGWVWDLQNFSLVTSHGLLMFVDQILMTFGMSRIDELQARSDAALHSGF